MSNRKKAASLIAKSIQSRPDYVQKLGGEPGSSGKETDPFPKFPDTEGGEKGMGLESAMDDFLSAMDRKDSKGMAKAFKHAHMMALDDDSDEED
jgi:hypothetical protein